MKVDCKLQVQSAKDKSPLSNQVTNNKITMSVQQHKGQPQEKQKHGHAKKGQQIIIDLSLRAHKNMQLLV